MKFCVYITSYHGDLLPPYYLGSTSIEKIENGYIGSVSSKRYKNLWKQEIKNNPHLFSIEIISKHETRKEALEEELKFQHELNVKKSHLFMNLSYAIPNGFFGIDCSGENNWSYGQTKETCKGVEKRARTNSGENHWAFGKTKETSKGINNMALKQKGKTKENCEATRRGAEKQKGMKKPWVSKRMTKLPKEVHPLIYELKRQGYSNTHVQETLVHQGYCKVSPQLISNIFVNFKP